MCTIMVTWACSFRSRFPHVVRLRLRFLRQYLRTAIIALAWAFLPIVDATDTNEVASLALSTISRLLYATATVGYWTMILIAITFAVVVYQYLHPFQRLCATSIRVGDEFRRYQAGERSADGTPPVYPDINASSSDGSGKSTLMAFCERRDAERQALMTLLQGIADSASRGTYEKTPMMKFLERRKRLGPAASSTVDAEVEPAGSISPPPPPVPTPTPVDESHVDPPPQRSTGNWYETTEGGFEAHLGIPPGPATNNTDHGTHTPTALPVHDATTLPQAAHDIARAYAEMHPLYRRSQHGNRC